MWCHGTKGHLRALMWERTPLGPTSSPSPGAAVRTNRTLVHRNELAPGFDTAVACPGLRAPYPISRGELVAVRPPGALQCRGMAHWTRKWVQVCPLNIFRREMFTLFFAISHGVRPISPGRSARSARSAFEPAQAGKSSFRPLTICKNRFRSRLKKIRCIDLTRD